MVQPDLFSLAFRFSYAPAEHESFPDVVRLIDKVFAADGKGTLAKDYAFFAGEVLRDGSRYVDVVACALRRKRVSTVAGDTKWKRKGAAGTVCDVEWPAGDEHLDRFLEKWSSALKAARPTSSHGSHVELLRKSAAYHENERLRIGRRRRPTRPRRGQWPRLAPPSSTPRLYIPEVSSVNSKAGVLICFFMTMKSSTSPFQ